MATLAHVSDLHFGRENLPVVEALSADIKAIKPDMVINSGDSTQRSRNGQWRRARAFLEGLGIATMSVCGNHDIPLFNVLLRAFQPYSQYHKWMGDAEFPTLFTPTAAIVGVQTARPIVPNPFGFWKDGVISDEQLETMGELFGSAAPAAMRIVVAHHPLAAPEGFKKRHHHICWRAEAALEAFGEMNVSMILSGHLHWSYAIGKGRILCVQAGTGVSSRKRGLPNSYNVLRFDSPEGVEVERREFDGEKFALAKTERWKRSGLGWEEITV